MRASFHIVTTAAGVRAVDGVNVSYTIHHDLHLSGYELPGRAGIYNITTASGTRTYNGGNDSFVSVTMALFDGYPADNLLYAGTAAYHANGDCYLDAFGLGQLQYDPTAAAPADTAC